MITNIFKVILLMSAIGSILTVILLIIKPITKKIFSPKWQYYIWLTVLIVMILPVSIKLPDKTTEMFEDTTNTDKVITDLQDLPINNVQPQAQVIPKAPIALQLVLSDTPSIPINVINVASLIWVVGVILFFTLKIIRYIIFLKTIYQNSQVAECAKIDIDKITIRTTDMIGAPLIIGLFHPVLLLPNVEITDENLNYILLHEMTHYRRHDLLYKWFAMLVNSIHWFNPFIYIVSKQIDEECEISCDLSVVANMTEQEQNNYMSTILSLLSASKIKTKLLTTQMASNKKMLMRRFTMIKNSKKTGKIISMASIIIALSLFSAVACASGIINGNSLEDSDKLNTDIETDKIANNKANVFLYCIDDGKHIDASMLISLNKTTGDISLLAIPRDLLIIKDEKNIKFSQLLYYGSEQDLINTVRNEIGVPVNYYVGIDFEAFRNIIDKLGGVEYDVPFDMHYSDPYENLNISLSKGRQILNGEQAEWLLRYRKGYSKGDIGRIEVLQNFIKEIIRQKFTFNNILKIKDVVEIVSKEVITNYPISNLVNDMESIKIISSYTVNTFVLPGNGKSINKYNYYVVDDSELMKITNQYFKLD